VQPCDGSIAALGGLDFKQKTADDVAKLLEKPRTAA